MKYCFHKPSYWSWHIIFGQWTQDNGPLYNSEVSPFKKTHTLEKICIYWQYVQEVLFNCTMIYENNHKIVKASCAFYMICYLRVHSRGRGTSRRCRAPRRSPGRTGRSRTGCPSSLSPPPIYTTVFTFSMSKKSRPIFIVYSIKKILERLLRHSVFPAWVQNSKIHFLSLLWWRPPRGTIWNMFRRSKCMNI